MILLVVMIIAITGPAGAGKDTASDYIADKLHIPHISGGDILREMLTSLGLEPKKIALGPFGTFLRSYYGGAFVPSRVIEKANGQSVVASGFRSPSEANVYKQKNAIIIYIDAPEDNRHSRITDRSREDDITKTEILKLLDQQEHGSTDPMAENLENVKPMADIVVMNDGALEDFYKKLDEVCVSLEDKKLNRHRLYS